MKKIILITIAIISYGSVFSQKYKIDNQSSTLKWQGKAAVGTYEVKGTLSPLDGVVILSGDTISQIQITINMQSLQSDYPNLTKHLKSKDFFHVKKFEVARFIMNTASNTANDLILAEGDFEIKGVLKTKKVSFKLKREKEKILLNGKLKLDRTAYGITYNSESFFDDLKDQAIADMFEVEFNLAFVTD